MLGCLFLIWPIAPVIGAGFLIQSGLQESRADRGKVGVGVTLLGLICWWSYYLASGGLLLTIAAYVTGFLVACTAVAYGLQMAQKLRGQRHIAALGFAILFPAAVFATIGVGGWQAPEPSTQRNSNLIIQALQQYHSDTGLYPDQLADLEPRYLDALPEAWTTQGTGWLYERTNDDFTLGYWYAPYKFGAEVCLYEPVKHAWECGTNNWGPFHEVPTPMACVNDKGKIVDTANCK